MKGRLDVVGLRVRLSLRTGVPLDNLPTYIGLDVHPATIVAAVLDHDGKLVSRFSRRGLRPYSTLLAECVASSTSRLITVTLVASALRVQDRAAIYKSKCVMSQGPNGEGQSGPKLAGTSMSEQDIVGLLTKGATESAAHERIRWY